MIQQIAVKKATTSDSQEGTADDGESLKGSLQPIDVVKVGRVERRRAGDPLRDGYHDDDDERPADGSAANDGPHGRDGVEDYADAGLEEALVAGLSLGGHVRALVLGDCGGLELLGRVRKV